MALQHGKETVIKLGGQDISAFTNNNEPERESTEHVVTCYGVDDEVVAPGLKKGKNAIGGMYVKGATGPRALVEALLGTIVTLQVMPEGEGTGLPQESVSVHVKTYKETLPVGDYIRWTSEITYSGPVDSAPQA